MKKSLLIISALGLLLNPLTCQSKEVSKLFVTNGSKDAMSQSLSTYNIDKSKDLFLLKECEGSTYLYFNGDSKSQPILNDLKKTAKANGQALTKVKDKRLKTLFEAQTKKPTEQTTQDISKDFTVGVSTREFRGIARLELIGYVFSITNNSPKSLKLDDIKLFNSYTKYDAFHTADMLMVKTPSYTVNGVLVGPIAGGVYWEYITAVKDAGSVLNYNKTGIIIKPHETIEIGAVGKVKANQLTKPCFELIMSDVNSNTPYVVTNKPVLF